MPTPTFVIKIGGEIVANKNVLANFCNEIAMLSKKNINIVIVHGGGQQATAMAEKLNVPTKMINGRRVTDEATLDIVKMVFAGQINIELLAELRRAKISAVGMSGVDGNLVSASRRVVEDIDYGFVGDISHVNPEILQHLLQKKYIPVVASLAADDLGQIYNINADTLAVAIAVSINADQLILLTNVDGVYDEKGDVIPHLSLSLATQLIGKKIIHGGMIPKIKAATQASNFIQQAYIANGTKAGVLLDLLENKKSSGTTITRG